MSGLDPFGRRDVRELIHEQRQRGATVLLSSHILPDVEMLCDRVAIILNGRLTRVATVGELVGDSRQQVEIRCTGVPPLEITPELRSVVERRDRPYETVFLLDDDTRLNETLAWLLRSGADVRAVTPQRATLEDLFLAAAVSADAGPSPQERRSA
jgi:ABC-2 type transport system ATP-binding protein